MYTPILYIHLYQSTTKFEFTQGLHKIRTLTTIAGSFFGAVTIVTRAVGYTRSGMFTRRISARFLQHETNTNIMTSDVRTRDKIAIIVIAHDYAKCAISA